jgi:probable HAF family extracellular repeat protein
VLPLPGGADRVSWAEDVNDAGDVVGWWNPPGWPAPDGSAAKFQPLFWIGDSVINPFDESPNLGGKALAINDRGQIVGYWYDTTVMDASGQVEIRAFRWEHGVFTDLGVRAAGGDPADVNNKGEIVYGSRHGGPRVNNAGDIVWGNTVIWANGTQTELPCGGWDISDKKVVLLGCADENGLASGYLWQNDVLTPLPTPPGTDYGVPLSINNRGQVGGYAWMPGQGLLPILWSPVG